jgi:hypothetical protein
MLSGLLNSTRSPYKADSSASTSQTPGGHRGRTMQQQNRERSSSADIDVVALEYIPVSVHI